MTELDKIDKKILNRIQSDFPVTTQPYLKIAIELNLTEELILKRIKQMKSNGIIRRIGGNFVPEKLGFISTLCAAKVPEEKIESFTMHVNKYPGVTHNYQRDNDYNIWFTFIAPSMDEIKNRVQAISEATGINEILNLPATKVFKIKAHFDL
ncbi:MAG: AsnC family transcriptional regulator [Deltaproteobacteria bacterium]|nr:AsnC family transcriptional regulator [Deltaproteobacteria bacterium]